MLAEYLEEVRKYPTPKRMIKAHTHRLLGEWLQVTSHSGGGCWWLHYRHAWHAICVCGCCLFFFAQFIYNAQGSVRPSHVGMRPVSPMRDARCCVRRGDPAFTACPCRSTWTCSTHCPRCRTWGS